MSTVPVLNRSTRFTFHVTSPVNVADSRNISAIHAHSEYSSYM